MSLQDPQAEPSMEEILASIRRIISEEEAPPPADDPLELTQPADADDAGGDDDLVFEAMEPEPAPAPPAIEAAPLPPRAHQPLPALGEPGADMIVSPPAASAAAGALARLAGQLRIADKNETIEGMVRELLKPMLKEWLDDNLPAIVEAQVTAELERIARMVR